MELGGVGKVPVDAAWLPSCIGIPVDWAARAAVMLDRGLWATAAITEGSRS